MRSARVESLYRGLSLPFGFLAHSHCDIALMFGKVSGDVREDALAAFAGAVTIQNNPRGKREAQ